MVPFSEDALGPAPASAGSLGWTVEGRGRTGEGERVLDKLGEAERLVGRVEVAEVAAEVWSGSEVVIPSRLRPGAAR